MKHALIQSQGGLLSSGEHQCHTVSTTLRLSSSLINTTFSFHLNHTFRAPSLMYDLITDPRHVNVNANNKGACCSLVDCFATRVTHTQHPRLSYSSYCHLSIMHTYSHDLKIHQTFTFPHIMDKISLCFTSANNHQHIQ